MADKYVPRMKQRYDEVIAQAMTEKFGYKNHMEVPKIEKITINMGVGETTTDKKILDNALADMTRRWPAATFVEDVGSTAPQAGSVTTTSSPGCGGISPLKRCSIGSHQADCATLGEASDRPYPDTTSVAPSSRATRRRAVSAPATQAPPPPPPPGGPAPPPPPPNHPRSPGDGVVTPGAGYPGTRRSAFRSGARPCARTRPAAGYRCTARPARCWRCRPG